MEDSQIVDLYWRREEAAISATARKYGTFCHRISRNILSAEEDAEECVNDTYIHAWNSIPPQRPNRLGAYLGRVVRNLSINLWHKNHAQKRYSGIEALLSEIEECIPSRQTVEHKVEEIELTGFLNAWLASLPRDDRILFLRRYWYGEALNTLEQELGVSHGKLAKRMYRLRAELREALEKEGYSL
ncbi:sigma-70 family RNA polymerase sigma factor [Oscillibacter sp. MSJ-2]|uniref:Sigma-70 family RNA polymerase sigma factor n=1 Tax=Dysosmobacter acutus TaxID=2841504 RepID=A0ABS6FB89_9FIRM|nr:sigma-70 family RNA polymerase sigma factor [Dysosmobacter acutus]MBU5627557.1 sigma-70 family RNA polymerase sigma factor [Dysosmobacter acutus]